MTVRMLVSGIIASGVCAGFSVARAQSAGDAIAVQGLQGNTLVAGKSTAFRFFTTAALFASVSRIDVSIQRPDGSALAKSWTKPEFTSIGSSRAGPSVVVLVRGADLPWIGSYHLSATALAASGARLATFVIEQFQLLPTKDIIVAIDRVHADAVNPGSAAELQAARDAMARLGAIWPIRDGVSTIDGDRTAGLRFEIQNKPQPYGCDGNPKHSDCQVCPFFASRQHRTGGVDNINLAIGYRFTDPREDFGGIAPNFCSGQSVGWASIVMSGPLAPGFAQETGHVFGLEPKNDPHFDPTLQAGHSKDDLIDAAATDLGFDIQVNRAFPAQVHDVMHQAVCGCPNDQTSYNTWDWEFLRAHFAAFSSTGPNAPSRFMTDAAPGIAGVGNTMYLFGKRADGRVFYNTAVMGQGGRGWAEVDGGIKTSAAPSAAAIGAHVFVAVRGLDGEVMLNQADEGRHFGQWVPLRFQTDVAPAVATVRNRVVVFAVSRDKRIFATQAVMGQPFSPWFELQGHGQTNLAPSAAAVGTHLFVGITGLNGLVQLNQAELGSAYSGWQSLNFTSDAAPGLASVGGSVLVFAKALNGTLQLDQAPLGRAFSGWFEVQGRGQTNVAPAAAAIGNHIFVTIRGGDGFMQTNQTDFGKAFGSWRQ